uniref:Keratin 99 n=1 Tax=Lates calcarifer TaxID=8187 RepID=A0A4W6C9I2_LATCA
MTSSRTVHSSYSSRSISSASSLGLSGAMQFGQTRISTGGPLLGRTPSVYGGAGGYGTRISQATFFNTSGSGSLNSFGDTAVINNEKVTMQNLNDRLASYLEKVRSLEAANKKLELQIREYYEKRSPTASRDYTAFFATITDLRAKLSENQSVILQIDNAQLAAEDFKLKYETELHGRTMVEADVARLRGVRDSLTLGISDLEMQIEGLKEELAYLKSNHEEVSTIQLGTVNVEVDSAESVDLTKILEEMREQYEAVVAKNKMEVEKWFQTKVETLRTTISACTTEVKTSYSELSELKRTYQSLEINRQSVLTEVVLFSDHTHKVKSRYSVQLSQLQVIINRMEVELQQLRASIEQQQSEYNLLLDLKMRLELEIAEYRRLLEGDLYEKKRVKTIVEEIVDGRVVSSSVDTQVEDIQ